MVWQNGFPRAVFQKCGDALFIDFMKSFNEKKTESLALASLPLWLLTVTHKSWPPIRPFVVLKEQTPSSLSWMHCQTCQSMCERELQ